MKATLAVLSLVLFLASAGMAVAQEGEALPNYPWDGESPETPLLIGDTIPVLDGEGSLAVKWFVRDIVDVDRDFCAPFIDPEFNDGYSTDGIEPPFLPKADKDFEWVLIWAEFTCEQEVCGPLEAVPFYLAGDFEEPYQNILEVDGQPMEGLLTGELSRGEVTEGWIVFYVDYYLFGETSLTMWDGGEEPVYFLIDEFPPEAILVVVTTRGTTPLYDCPSEDCQQIERAISDEYFLLLEVVDNNWFLVRNAFGKIGYLSIQQATPNDE